MPKRKIERKFASLGEKDCWHPYSLQMLQPSKFTMVVGKILRGRYLLISQHISQGYQQRQ
ncbi:MAG: hypothetical protein DRP47_09495 [Candidatus Zixiibacteriota bacterium]|nr:MAG: hypothetical protein DRP47_09495 [candidate division Zixibacteria bacterium]